MFSFKCVLLLTVCVILSAKASPIEFENFYEPEQAYAEEYEIQPIPVRRARSPQGGVSAIITDGPNGREGSITYNHNLYTSNDGRGTIDAYAQGNHNFDRDHGGFNGGIVGSWKF